MDILITVKTNEASQFAQLTTGERETDDKFWPSCTIVITGPNDERQGFAIGTHDQAASLALGILRSLLSAGYNVRDAYAAGMGHIRPLDANMN